MREIIILLLFSILLNFASFKKEIDHFFKNKLLEYYNKGELNEEDLKQFKDLTKTKFESFKINNTKDLIKVSMVVQKTGKYNINCSQTKIWLYNAEGKLISNFEEKDKIYLLNNNIIYAQFLYLGILENIQVNIEYLNNYNLPFDPINIKKEKEIIYIYIQTILKLFQKII